MTAAAATVNFVARHAERTVLTRRHGVFQRRPETRPTGTAVEFGLRMKTKPDHSRHRRNVPVAMFIVECAGIGPFGAFFTQDRDTARRLESSAIQLSL
jgi:hypothetical protein